LRENTRCSPWGRGRGAKGALTFRKTGVGRVNEYGRKKHRKGKRKKKENKKQGGEDRKKKLSPERQKLLG